MHFTYKYNETIYYLINNEDLPPALNRYMSYYNLVRVDSIDRYGMKYCIDNGMFLCVTSLSKFKLITKYVRRNTNVKK